MDAVAPSWHYPGTCTLAWTEHLIQRVRLSTWNGQVTQVVQISCREMKHSGRSNIQNQAQPRGLGTQTSYIYLHASLLGKPWGESNFFGMFLVWISTNAEVAEVLAKTSPCKGSDGACLSSEWVLQRLRGSVVEQFSNFDWSPTHGSFIMIYSTSYIDYIVYECIW